MVLLLAHPELPTCVDCQAWLHGANWKRDIHRGQPVPRPPNSKTPCWKCPKAENEKPNPDAELTDAGHQMLAQYYRVKAGAPMPADPVVQWYCGILRWVEDQVERNKANVAALIATLAVGRKGDERSHHRSR